MIYSDVYVWAVNRKIRMTKTMTFTRMFAFKKCKCFDISITSVITDYNIKKKVHVNSCFGSCCFRLMLKAELDLE